MSDLGVALIGGAGFMGKVHSMAYSLLPLAGPLPIGVRKQLLVDVAEESAATAAAQLGWQEHTTDWRAAVARPDIAIVDVCTPAGFHEEIVLEALAHGKHVFCEKPLTPSVDGAEAIARKAAEARVTTQVGFCYRYSPAVQYGRELLASGELGVPLQFRGAYLMDYLFDGSSALLAPGTIGSQDDIGSHLIDMAQSLVGDIVSVCGLVSANTVRLARRGDVEDLGGREPAPGLDDGGVFVAKFENGAIGTFSHSLLAHGRANNLSFELDASRGALRFDWNRRDEIDVCQVGGSPRSSQFRTIVAGPKQPGYLWPEDGIGVGYLDGHVLQMRDFVQAVAAGEPGNPSFADGARVQRVAAAVVESMEHGGWIDVA